MLLIRISICLYVCILSFNSISAQTDTAAVNNLIRVGRTQQQSQPDSAIYNGKKALKLLKESEYIKGKIYAYNLVGMAYWAKGEFNTGLHFIKHMIEEARKAKDTVELGSAYGNMAILYIDMGDRKLGLQYSKKAIKMLVAVGDSTNAIHYINNIGWIYEAEKKYDSSIVYYTAAIHGYKKYHGAVSWLGQTYANLSSVYYKTDNPQKALEYAEEGLELCRKFKDNKKATGHAYLSMSKAYLSNNRYRYCLLYADSALQLAQATNLNTLKAEAYWLKYKSSEELGTYKQAVEYLEQNRVWTDTLVNAETKTELAAINTQLATEKKDKEIALKEMELIASQAARQRNLYYLLLAVITTIFSIVVAYQIYRRQQLRIQTKNKQLEVEQKEKELMSLQLSTEEKKNNDLNKELLSFTITTTQKNQLLQDIYDELNDMQGAEPSKLRKVKHIINNALTNEEEWEEFRVRFEQVHQSFFDNIKADYPQLTANDLRLCAFIKLDLSSKQIASLLNIAPSSVDISKYRLKKKLTLNKEDNMTIFMMKY